MTKPSIGEAAPAFTALDQDGHPHSLKDYKGKKIVLFFYPKDNTPTCTTEACNLRDHHSELSKAGYVLLGVSTDSAKSHKGFADKHQLPYKLLVDTDKILHEAYGVWGEKSMYGRKYMGTLRTTFVIDEYGTITKVIDSVKAKTHHLQLQG